VNVMEYLIRSLLDERPVREPNNWSILRTGKFTRQPEEFVAQFVQGQALPFFGKTGPLKSCD